MTDKGYARRKTLIIKRHSVLLKKAERVKTSESRKDAVLGAGLALTQRQEAATHGLR